MRNGAVVVVAVGAILNALGTSTQAFAQEDAPDSTAVRLPGLAVTVRRSMFDPGLARSVERWAPGDGTSAWQGLADWLDARGASSVRGFGGGGRQVLSIRGSRPEGVLVLLDGVPLNDPVTGTADLSTVSLASLASVTLVRGAGAARYGSGALGGALLLESGTGGDGRSARVIAGSFGRREASGRAGVQTDGTSLDLAAGVATADNDYAFANRLVPGAPEETRSGADHTAFWAGAGLRTDRLRANARLDDLERGIPGRSGTTAFAGSRWAERRASASASYMLPGAALRAGVRRLAMTYTPGDDGDPARQHTADARAGVEGELPGPLPALVALRFSAERLTGDGVAEAPTRLAAGATLRSDLRFGGAGAEVARFGLEPAVSVDVTRGTSAASPELGAWWRTGEGSRVFARVGRAFRIPTFADLHFEAAPGVRANPDLEAERVVLDAELGAEFGRTLGAGDAAVSVAAWRRDTRRPIVWLGSSVAVWSPRNLDRLLAYGLDLDASYARRAPAGLDWSVDAAFSWQRSRVGFGTNRNPLPYQPGLTGRLGAELRGGPGALRLDGRYVGSRTTSLAATRQLGAHATLDATVRRGFALGAVRLDASLAVLNVLDRRYELVELFPEPGRRFAVTLDVH